MRNLFFEGGAPFMSILTILLIITTAWIVYHVVRSYISNDTNREKILRQIGYGKSIGLFAMIVGISGQMVGLLYAFDSMHKVADISPALVFGGIKASIIPTLYGIVIYLFSLLLWFIASVLIEMKQTNKLSG